MSQIKINYADIYERTARMRGQITTCLNQMDAEYRQLHRRLINNTDGAASAAIGDAIEENRIKSYEMASTLQKLVSFMTNSTRQIEAEEIRIANAMGSATRRSSGINSVDRVSRVNRNR